LHEKKKSLFEENLTISLFLAKNAAKNYPKNSLYRIVAGNNALIYAIRVTQQGNYLLSAERVA